MARFFEVRRGGRPALCLRGLAVAVGTVCLVIAELSVADAQSTKAPAPAFGKAAPVSSDPASTSASYGDWVLRCQRVGDGDKVQRLCEVSQTIQAQNQRDPIAEVAFGRLPNDPALRITVALPPSVSFPSTVDVASTTPTTAVQLQWKRCLPGGCFADAVAGDDAIKVWRGNPSGGKLTFKDAGAHDITVPVSFRGLSQALDALGK